MSQTSQFAASVDASAVDQLIQASFSVADIANLTLLSSKAMTLKTNTPGTNEKQTLTITGTPTGGTFTVTLGGQTTAAIAFNASAAVVKAAIEKLTTVGMGNTSCTGGALPGSAVVIEFVGALAIQDVALATTTDSLTGGSTPASAIATTQAGVAPGDTIYLIGGKTLAWAAGVDEVQSVTISGTPTGGTFTLTYSGQTTSGIAFSATAATVQAALEALSNVAVGEAVCTGGPLPGAAVSVEFEGTLGGLPQPALRAVSSLTGGTNPAVAVAITTQGASYQDKPFTADVTALYATVGVDAASFQAKIVTT